jgi:hypothetical protein
MANSTAAIPRNRRREADFRGDLRVTVLEAFMGASFIELLCSDQQSVKIVLEAFI